MRPDGLLERLLLARFSRDERAEIVRDLTELAEGRGPVAGRIYFVTELIKYPIREAWDGWTNRSPTRRERQGRGGMDGMVRDLRYAIRGLARSAGFTTMAIAILAVSIGATAAIVSVIDGVLLQPLPIHEPDRLHSVWLVDDTGDRARMTPGNVIDVRGLEGAFSGVAAFGSQTASLSVEGDPIFLRGSRVTPGYFETLGVEPVAGRGFTREEGEAGGPAVVVLGHALWMEMFGGDPGAVRQSIELDGGFFEIVGVAPPGVYPTHATVSAELPFTSSSQDFFVPLRYADGVWDNRRSHVLGAIARRAPGVPTHVAEEQLGTLSDRLQSEGHPNSHERLLLTSFTEEVVGDVRFGLWTLLATVGLVLVIALVNVGSLFVLRADDRRDLYTIRVALGASRGQLVRHMVIESALVAVVASALAVGVAQLMIGAMKALVPYQIPRLDGIGLDGVAFVSTVVVGVVATTLFAAGPARRLRGAGVGAEIVRGRQGSAPGRRRLHTVVVAVQAALCVLVLVAGGLLGRSYAALRAVDTGFEALDAWTMSVNADAGALREIVEDVRALAGIAAAAVAYDHPLQRNWGDGFAIEGVPRGPDDPPVGGSLRAFGAGYFETVQIPVVKGRVPDALDMEGEVGYAVVNEALVRAYFADKAAIGARIVVPSAARLTGGDGVFEIVGVVRDVSFLGPAEEPSPAFYLPLSHFPASASRLLVRAERPGIDVVAGVRNVVARVAPGVGVQRARVLGDVLDDMLARPRFNAMLLVIFGGVGLLLCGLGVYGLMGRVVAMRRREIGVQMALGADRALLARSVLVGALTPMFVGGAVGVAAAFGLSSLIRSLLFGISPADPVSFAGSAAILVTIGVVAAAAPTARAVSIDPASVLRDG
ncbi:MAG: ADOP family duplicated permease [Gemmatimonadota bacterium]